MNVESLRGAIAELVAQPAPSREAGRPVVERLLRGLESGSIRAAERRDGVWQAAAWVKQGILLAFRIGENQAEHAPPFHFRDRDTFATWDPAASGRNVRIVPGGTSVRSGAYLGDGVVVMPPAYVNVGAYIDDGSMLDSHALIGSCAQIGKRVHVSAAVQVGGVLEPVGALPVIVEDDVFLGGGCGVYEGTRVERGAVLGAGVVLTRAVALYDLVHERIRTSRDGVLVVPAGAVVVPGARRAGGGFAESHGIDLQAPVIVKYRDEGTSAGLALEEALR